MKYLDLTLATPAENLACDEALLDGCEEGHCADEILRFWEPQRHFVVVGYANRVATEVNVAACEARGIPLLRRCSGGGTVLQGPGCLNYSLILKIDAAGPLHSIASTNRFIMERNRAAVESLLTSNGRGNEAPSFKSEVRSPKSEVEVRGHTDLALNAQHPTFNTQLKFSGNSQRRRKHFLLFHGTFLLNFDLALVSEVLRMPLKQPDYRKGRTHAKFLTNLNMPAAKVKAALQEMWDVDSPLKNPPLEEIPKLAREKYTRHEWNFKF
jgi:lipoate---protein ligase